MILYGEPHYRSENEIKITFTFDGYGVQTMNGINIGLTEYIL